MVDFLIIGAQKAGTSSLDNYLRNHPDIAMANKKELHFFDNEVFFSNSPVDYSSYKNAFEDSPLTKVRGEATPIYLYWKPACERIWEYNKEMKLIVILRNPIDRAYSHWNMEYKRGKDEKGFSFAIRNEKNRVQEAPQQQRVYSYIDRGLYSVQLKRYRSLFREEQMLVLKYDDYCDEQKNTLHQIFTFLNVNPDKFSYTPEKVRGETYTTQMTGEDRDYLIDIYSEEVAALERMLDWDCSDWLR